MPWELDELGMRIDFPRLKRDLTELGAIGRTAEGGVSRPSFSEADMRALKYHVQVPNGQYDGRVDNYVLATTEGAAPAPMAPASGGGSTPPPTHGPVVNLTLHKPATQSSVYNGTGVDQGPQFGNDGIRESQPRDPYLLVITEADNPPWWQVDLQDVHTLTQLTLYNRKACCQEKAKTVQVLLSTDGATWEPAYTHNGTPFDVLTVDLTGRTARYVRIQLTERVSLHFQECEVYGY